MRILIAVDGSEEAYEAVRTTAYLQPADEVVLLHVLDLPTPRYPMLSPKVSEEISTSVEHAMRKEGERVLAQAAWSLPVDSGTITKLMEVGKPTDLIMSVAEEHHIDLILLGARGVGPMKELLVGSVSHRVLAHAHCPVLIVRNPLKSLNHILVPVKNSEDADAAVEFLARTPFRKLLDVTILTAVPFSEPPWPVGVAVSESMKAEVLEKAGYFVEDVAFRLPPDRYRAKGQAVIGTPATAILQEVSKSSPDLVLMGSRGRKGITRFVLGSVSHAVLHQATCPVMMFPWPGV